MLHHVRLYAVTMLAQFQSVSYSPPCSELPESPIRSHGGAVLYANPVNLVAKLAPIKLTSPVLCAAATSSSDTTIYNFDRDLAFHIHRPEPNLCFRIPPCVIESQGSVPSVVHTSTNDREDSL
ncbi:hypothetical protein J6590_081925 [Homalodisca vitripennis]|nr:hypothetical protein J6590_081925 [Homalodisca vitripennis]